MATIAGILDRFSLSRAYDQAVSQTRAGDDQPFRIRAIAHEQIYFFAKRIDNSRVVRQAEPRAGKIAWRSIGSGFTGAVILVAVLLPALYGMLEGIQLETLRKERQRLIADRSVLELRETQLTSSDRLERLAFEQHFIDPDPQSIVYVSGKPDGTLAQAMAPPPMAAGGASN